MTEEKIPAQNPAQNPAPAAAPAKPTLPLPACTARDCRIAALLFVHSLFAANCTALCRTGIG